MEVRFVREHQQSLDADVDAITQTNNSFETRYKQLSQPTQIVSQIDHW